MDKNLNSTFGTRLGLTAHEVSKFDWHAFITAAARGDAAKLGMYRELSDATGLAANRAVSGPSSYFIPSDVLDPQTRDLQKSDGTGAHLVGVTTPTFAEVFRGSSLLDVLPVRRLDGLIGDATIPKMTSVSASWLGENDVFADAALTLGQIALSPKTIGAFVLLSHQFHRQSSASASAFIETELARKLGSEIGSALLAGTGLLGAPITPFSVGAVNEQAGGTMSWAKAVDMLTPCESVGDARTVRWVAGPNAASVLRKKVRETGQASYIFDEGRIAGYRCIVSSVAPTGVLFCANWDAIVAAQWQGVELSVSPFGRTGTTDFRQGLIAVRITAMVDFAGLAPAALSRTTGTVS